MSLDELQAKLNESQNRFLRAVQEHNKEDAEIIAKQFLDKFLDPEPKRSDLARAFANETIDLMRSFSGETAGMVSSVVILRLKLNSLASGWQVEAIKHGLQNIGVPGGAAAFAAKRKGIEARAVEAGELAIRIEALASSIVELRTLTMRAFRDENIKVSLTELVKRIRKEADDETRAALKDEAWSAIKEILDEFGDLALDEAPLLRWRKVIEKGAKILGPKEVDTSPGGTDTMLELLGVLRKESRALSALDQSYQDSLARLDVLAP